MISGVLVLHGLTMDSRRQRPPDWRDLESTEDAVRRLTAMIDERNAKKAKAAGRLQAPAEILNQPRRSLAVENAAGEMLEGLGSINRQPQRPAAREDERSGIGMDCGQTDFQTVRFSYGSKGAVRPSSGSSPMPAERARHAPEDE
jgi:hypothetical protein